MRELRELNRESQIGILVHLDRHLVDVVRSLLSVYDHPRKMERNRKLFGDESERKVFLD